MRKNVLFILFLLAFSLVSFGQDRILSDFESDYMTFTVSNGDMDTAYVVDNPSKTGINTSDKVLKVEKPLLDNSWKFLNFTIAPQLDLIAHPVFSWKIHSPKAVQFVARFDNDIKWEQQMFSSEYKNDAQLWEVEAGEVNTWVEFEVDLSKYPFNRFVSIALGISLNDSTAGTFYIDDVK